ncbi:MAG: uroporphyrinogen decarboxylase family protein [Planctomycetota bacterium]|nr:uroporphyrinogen decarboxylase family protein [Planctomycetota bacterium]
MITISGTLSKAWMAEALGVAFDRDYYFDPKRRHAIDTKCNDYAAERFAGMRLFYSESNLGQIDYWDKNQVLIGGIQPNMILGMLLGADFVPDPNHDADITPRCLAGKSPSDLPTPESLLEHPLIRLFDKQIRQAQKTLWPIPPFFWDVSGRATIHGMLTSAQKFLGESIFMDMVSEPQQCLDIMAWIADACIILCRHFSKIADLPITSVHVGECSSCLVSPEMVERFVVPATSRIGAELGPVRLHSCGPSTNYAEPFSQIENLCSLDLGGDTSIRRMREVFGNEMPLSVAPLPQDMSARSAEPILNWAGRTLEENGSGDLEFVYHLEPSYNLDTVYALTDFVQNPH